MNKFLELKFKTVLDIGAGALQHTDLFLKKNYRPENINLLAVNKNKNLKFKY